MIVINLLVPTPAVLTDCQHIITPLVLFRPRPQEDPVAILRDDRQDDGDGNFKYEFESVDGTFVSAVGTPGAAGQSNIQGSYRFTLPDGTIAEVTYIANENGFQPQSDLLPTSRPSTAAANSNLVVQDSSF
ncbi:cuticle protein AMP1A-like [Penaeus chinensis]|uniref:cuticle protein AMP1A-like n=1 Tax=Penaeus chinensis TaxID=139456 RepID=UPI001FB5EAD3|nr:cuticle protein AMP1A-like [Penaeus chinensis]